MPYRGLTTVSVCPLQTKKALNALLWSYNSLCLSSSDQEGNERLIVVLNSLCLSSSDQEGNECLIVVLQQSLSVLFRSRRHWMPYCCITTVSVCLLKTKKVMNALSWSYNSLCLSSSGQVGIECLIIILQQSLSVFLRPRSQWTPYRGLTTVSVCPLQIKKALNALLLYYNSLCLSS